MYFTLSKIKVNPIFFIVFLKHKQDEYWRFNAARFSRQWMMAVHIPVPFVFLLRIVSGFGWKVIPLLMISFAAGQFAGGKLRKFYAH